MLLHLGKFGIEPGIYDIQCKEFSGDAGAEREDIGVIMFPCKSCHCHGRAESAAYSGDFVTDDRNAYAGRADNDAAFRLTGSDCLRCGADHVRIVTGICAVASVILDFKSLFRKMFDNFHFQVVSAVIRSNCYHKKPP